MFSIESVKKTQVPSGIYRSTIKDDEALYQNLKKKSLVNIHDNKTAKINNNKNGFVTKHSNVIIF